jgi:hypothetical protein
MKKLHSIEVISNGALSTQTAQCNIDIVWVDVQRWHTDEHLTSFVSSKGNWYSHLPSIYRVSALWDNSVQSLLSHEC